MRKPKQKKNIYMYDSPARYTILFFAPIQNVRPNETTKIRTKRKYKKKTYFFSSQTLNARQTNNNIESSCFVSFISLFLLCFCFV